MSEIENSLIKASGEVAARQANMVQSRIDPNGVGFTICGLSSYEVEALFMKSLVDNDGSLYHDRYKIIATGVHEFPNDPALYAVTFTFPSDYPPEIFLKELDGVRKWRGSVLDVSSGPVSGFHDFITMPAINGELVTKMDKPCDPGINGTNRYHRTVQKRSPLLYRASLE